ncbi:hypothetical protein INR49_022473 [Caranx melampygus]|nr:hypothetical protein INR49_022473 [Caranx melampygus]
MGGGGDGCSPQRPMSLLPRLETPLLAGGEGDLDGLVFPCSLAPPWPHQLLSLKQSQICSAGGLLELYCTKNYWFQPEYHLYSTPGQDGKQLLLYKVVIPSMQSTYIPDKLCTLLEDAKELAAQTALWNWTCLFWAEPPATPPAATPPPSSSPPPARGSSPVAAGPSSPPTATTTTTTSSSSSSLPHPRPSPSPPLPPLPLSPTASQTRRFYFSSQTPFF